MSKLMNIMAMFVVLLFSSLLPATARAEVAQPGTYQIDPGHTSAQFQISHLGFSHLVGRFNQLQGTIVLDPKGKSSVEVTIQANSIDTNHKKRDDHLRGPDFFNVKQFPVLKFVSDKVTFNDKGEPTEITGKLSLHGKTNPVKLTVKAVGAGKDPWGGYRAGYDASTTIKRADYGMNYMPKGLGSDVKIILNVEAIKKK